MVEGLSQLISGGVILLKSIVAGDHKGRQVLPDLVVEYPGEPPLYNLLFSRKEGGEPSQVFRKILSLRDFCLNLFSEFLISVISLMVVRQQRVQPDIFKKELSTCA